METDNMSQFLQVIFLRALNQSGEAAAAVHCNFFGSYTCSLTSY